MQYRKSVMKNDKNILLHFGRLTNAELTFNDDNNNYNRRICLPTEAIRHHRTYNILYIYYYFVRVAANVRSSTIFYYV